MKFKNKAAARAVHGLVVEQGDDLDVAALAPAAGLSVEDLTAGLVLQCGDDGAWQPADDEAKAAVDAALAPKDEPQPKRSRSAGNPKE